MLVPQYISLKVQIKSPFRFHMVIAVELTESAVFAH